MRSTVVPSPDFQTAASNAVTGTPDYLDVEWDAHLVEGSFDPAVPASWPTASAHFTAITSDGVPTFVNDGATGKLFAVAPEPAGGWEFLSATITTGITVGGYIIKQGTTLIGAALITPVTITANSQAITLPYVALEIPRTPLPVDITPVPV